MVDLRGVDLNLLVSLDALLEECNVTRAAQRLHLSQSSVSAQLARLRLTFDDALLVPAESGRGMNPTARGLALVAPLRAALKDLETVVKQRPTFDPMRDERKFCLAASDNAAVTLGLPLIRSLNTSAGPGVRVAFVAPHAEKVAEQMERGEIDVLLGSARMVPQSMKTRPLISERFVMAQRKGHPRGVSPLDLDVYCSLEHVLVSTSGGSFEGFMDEHLTRIKRSRRVVLSVPQFTLVPEILRTTDYVCTLPGRLAKQYEYLLDAFELPFIAEGFTLNMAWHPRNSSDPSSIWLRQVLSQVSETSA